MSNENLTVHLIFRASVLVKEKFFHRLSVHILYDKAVSSVTVAVDPLDVLNLNVSVGSDSQILGLTTGSHLEAHGIDVAAPDSDSVLSVERK
jgi:hypothetical protein